MRIVLAHHELSHFGGEETYTSTVAHQLERQGHQVWVWAPAQGRAADLLREEGLRVPEKERDLPETIDAAVANDGIAAYLMADRYPGVPQAMVCHAETLSITTPPQLSGVVGGLVALHDRMARWARALAVDVEVVRLRQPVDVQRFHSTNAPHANAMVVLALGHYLRGPRLDVLRGVCDELGLELRVLGLHTKLADAPELQLAAADIVVGKARVIVEAMATGRAAYVFDHNGGDGWVTPERYAELEADNFGGQSEGQVEVVDAERLRRDLGRYDPSMGIANRDLAVANHAATKHVSQLIGLLQRLAPSSPPPDSPLAELARLVRAQAASEGRATVYSREIDLLRVELEREREQARQAHQVAERDGRRAEAAEAALVAERDDRRQWDAEVAERIAMAEAAEREVLAFRTSRRYRLAALLAQPFDRRRTRRPTR